MGRCFAHAQPQGDAIVGFPTLIHRGPGNPLSPAAKAAKAAAAAAARSGSKKRARSADGTGTSGETEAQQPDRKVVFFEVRPVFAARVTATPTSFSTAAVRRD
jgi:hypothetical protein